MHDVTASASSTTCEKTIVPRPAGTFFAGTALCCVLSATAVGAVEKGRPHLGSLHVPLGQAVLAVEGGSLVVSNLGESGEDGVWILFGEPAGFSFEIVIAPEELTSATAPAIAPRILGSPPPSIRIVGPDMMVDPNDPGAEPLPLFFLDLVFENGYWELQPDLGTSSPTYGLSILEGGVPLLTTSGSTGSFRVSALPRRVEVRSVSNQLRLRLDFAEPTDILYKGEQVATGDAILIRSAVDDPTIMGLGQTSWRDLALYVSGIASFALKGETVQELGVELTGLGDALLHTAPRRIEVRDFGTGGEDGATLRLGGVGSVRAELEATPTAPPLSTGASQRITFRDADGQPLALVEAVDKGERFVHRADFSSLGAATATVLLLRDGQLVAEIADFGGGLRMAPGLGEELGAAVLDDGTFCTGFFWHEPQSIEPEGHSPVLADGVMWLPEGGVPVSRDSIHRFDIHGAEVPDLAIVDLDFSLFSNGFESGEATAWSAVTGANP